MTHVQHASFDFFKALKEEKPSLRFHRLACFQEFHLAVETLNFHWLACSSKHELAVENNFLLFFLKIPFNN
jgi:hypothetical protein